MLTGDHKPKPIEAVTEAYREMMADLRQKLYRKIKRCHQHEKAAWKNLSEIESQIDFIYKRINTVKEELVSCMQVTSREGKSDSTLLLYYTVPLAGLYN